MCTADIIPKFNLLNLILNFIASLKFLLLQPYQNKYLPSLKLGGYIYQYDKN